MKIRCFTVLFLLFFAIPSLYSSTTPKYNEKHYILEASETVRSTSTHWDIPEFGGVPYEWIALHITYKVKLDDDSEFNLSLYTRTINVEELLSTFYLEPGDQIEFSESPGTEYVRDLGLVVYFTMIRDGVSIGNFKGFHSDWIPFSWVHD